MAASPPPPVSLYLQTAMIPTMANPPTAKSHTGKVITKASTAQAAMFATESTILFMVQPPSVRSGKGGGNPPPLANPFPRGKRQQYTKSPFGLQGGIFTFRKKVSAAATGG